MVLKEMSFKDSSYLQLCRPSCSVEPNFIGNFGRGHYVEHFFEFNLNLDQWFRSSCYLKIFCIYSSGCHLDQQS